MSIKRLMVTADSMAKRLTSNDYKKSIKVRLRAKPISGNRQSLYLDFYPPIPHPETGKPIRREFLELYIYDKPETDVEKQHNQDILNLAMQIQQERQLNIMDGIFSLSSEAKSRYFAECIFRDYECWRYCEAAEDRRVLITALQFAFLSGEKSQKR